MTDSSGIANNTPSVEQLQKDAQTLRAEIAELRGTKAKLLEQQLSATQTALERFANDHLKTLEERKQTLQIAVDQLERRQERVQAEMRQSFAGVSQDLAIRIHGFHDYLVTSLQDLVIAAEKLELAPKETAKPQTPAPQVAPTPRPEPAAERRPVEQRPPRSGPPRQSRPPQQRSAPPQRGPKFATQEFEEETRQIRQILDQYRTNPNYYGPPWQLRRTFEPIHAERVASWFFTFGGRGALRTLSSRLQNILVASATISILRQLYGNSVRTLILANSPERLGDWRRGLQDCLGIDRSDFGPERGLILFESPDALAQKADRLVKEQQLPLILIDDAEEEVSLSILQFPLWLAFAPEPQLRKERATFDWFE
ncbi:DUF3086 domain-containing protein [Acaryochloris sp. CCMEE 5410]|uniref:DUF3086 domain-containing protein n=1 Tax=Acaryochloris sp. CCMEE 5410 TaxID=310037 RepID=UPI0002484F98|nr:DUF3086 domain-containing protein [Acaryochloris sp. CCMEE 5410]KAI9133576.1 DUF3086 domain-containing protein [Acaryochloris sp. CCMEE 5410]